MSLNLSTKTLVSIPPQEGMYEKPPCFKMFARDTLIMKCPMQIEEFEKIISKELDEMKSTGLLLGA